jgi:hypothetical protein
MAERVVFYQLTHKFVHEEKDIPDGTRQIMYYSLAIGHHVGVMDCFQSLFDIPLEDYRQWVANFPDGIGRQKMEGLLKWGEIEINRSHAPDLLPVLKDSMLAMNTAQAHWSDILTQCLQKMMEEPALYLMVRKRT